MTEDVMVSRVIDGDTFVGSDGGDCRLANVNAPEAGTPGASAATQALKNLIEGRHVEIEVVASSYRRKVVNVWVDKFFVNDHMRALGYK